MTNIEQLKLYSCYVKTLKYKQKCKMKAKIINTKCEGKGLIFRYTIEFLDPYCNNVKRRVVGVAKCNPNDTFDAIKGSRIAESRAKKAMFDKLHRSVGYLAYKLAEELGNRRHQSKREIEHLHKLIYE